MDQLEERKREPVTETIPKTAVIHKVTLTKSSRISSNLKPDLIYYIAGKFGEFGKLSVIHQTKTIQISTYN